MGPIGSAWGLPMGSYVPLSPNDAWPQAAIWTSWESCCGIEAVAVSVELLKRPHSSAFGRAHDASIKLKGPLPVFYWLQVSSCCKTLFRGGRRITCMYQCRNPFITSSLMFINALAQKIRSLFTKMCLVLSKNHVKIPAIFSLQIIHRPMHPSTLHTSESDSLSTCSPSEGESIEGTATKKLPPACDPPRM